MVQTRIFGAYLRQIVLPRDLCADYGPYSLRDFPFVVCLVALALVLCAQFFLGVQGRLFALGSILFWAALLPVSNLVPLFRPMADRFLYVPLLGGAMLLAGSLFLMRDAAPVARRVTYGSVALWGCGLAFVSFQRERVWHDSLALWEETTRANPDSFTAADNLGCVLMEAGRLDEAAASFRRAIALSDGRNADPLCGLALVLEASHDSAGADAAFREAAALDPRCRRPAELVQALVMEPAVAGKLELLAHRNTKR